MLQPNLANAVSSTIRIYLELGLSFPCPLPLLPSLAWTTAAALAPSLSVLIAARRSCCNPSQPKVILHSEPCYGSSSQRKTSPPHGQWGSIGLGPCLLSNFTSRHWPPHSLLLLNWSLQMCKAHPCLGAFALAVPTICYTPPWHIQIAFPLIFQMSPTPWDLPWLIYLKSQPLAPIANTPRSCFPALYFTIALITTWTIVYFFSYLLHPQKCHEGRDLVLVPAVSSVPSM